ncbi:MAG: helix-turn-helix transcriptional regulator [Syntrophobacteria bacterium]
MKKDVDIGRSLKIALIQQDMSREELGKKVGRDKRYIDRRCVTEDCPISDVQKLCEALEMGYDEFVSLVG